MHHRETVSREYPKGSLQPGCLFAFGGKPDRHSLSSRLEVANVVVVAVTQSEVEAKSGRWCCRPVSCLCLPAWLTPMF